MSIERKSVPKHRMTAELPDEGAIGRSVYSLPGSAPTVEREIDEADRDRLLDAASSSDTGSVLFESDAGVALVVPPIPLTIESTFDEVHLAPLMELLERRVAYAVFLLRLGGFAVGFFRGNKLVDSKVDQRFVKGKHRKGGQSSTRFARIRENQARELFDKACETAQEKLTPYEDEIEHVFFGGDRRTLQAFEKECSYFERFGERLRSRTLPAHGDPRLAMLEGMPREVWSCEAYVVATGDEQPGG